MDKARLSEFAERAGFRVFGKKIVAADQGSSGLATISLEKFAELLILECARIAHESDCTMTGQGAASAQEFKDYFGIK